jgi:tRNA modification GTPase
MGLVLEELTPPGRGGISVVSLRGPGAWDRLRRLTGREAPPRRGEVSLVRLRAGDELIDEALLWSEGEERMEISLHGAPTVLRRIAEELDLPLVAAPTDLAAGGEPPPLEEQAERLLANAPSEAAARVLLDQAEGALRRALERLDPAEPRRFEGEVTRLLERGRLATFLLSPAVVVLSGPVNAGKSTLFNLLLDSERVVVSETGGTTRDAVRERGLLGAFAVDLVDTAGEREGVPDAAPERAGQELGRRLRAHADLVVWMSRDPEDPLEPPDSPDSRGAWVRITSACELLSEARRAVAPHPLSVLTDPRGARRRVERIFHEALQLPRDPWVPGAAVPFSAPLLRALEEARRATGESDRRRTVAMLLAR